MAVSKETYEKVAKAYDKKGARLWAEAKNNPNEGYKYAQARKAYGTAKTAREAAKKAK